MKPKEIQELLDFIASSGLAEVNIETESFKIAVKKTSDVQTRFIETPVQQIISAQPLVTSPVAQPQVVGGQPAVQESAPKKEEASKAEKNLITIKSPMIGTFYRSSSPDSPSFANVGDEVAVGQTVCIIEAMKLFNEIESDVAGKIVKILVENASPVEYDQPLFLVEPK
jgi:acetyl-CoA carboxylase biotin carboxyl carrier protein